MLDPLLLKNDLDTLRDNLRRRNLDIDLEQLIKLDESRRKLRFEAEKLRADQKSLGKDIATAESKEKEARTQIRVKGMVITDLTKRCTELSNRLKEFSALYEIVKNERNKYVNLIQSSTQALAEMREKIRILQNEVEILSNESTAKDKA